MPESDAVLGLAEKSAWRAYQVKGSLLASRPRYVRDQWGAAGLTDVASRLSPPMRALFQSAVLPFAWYPFQEMAEIDRAIVAGPMRGDVSHMKQLGLTIARYDLPTLYKMFFKLGTPSFVLKRINTAYATYIRGGTIEASPVSKNHAVVTQIDGDLPLYFCDQGILGWVSAAVELSGGRDVHVAQVDCVHKGAARCTWEASWEG